MSEKSTELKCVEHWLLEST